MRKTTPVPTRRKARRDPRRNLLERLQSRPAILALPISALVLGSGFIPQAKSVNYVLGGGGDGVTGNSSFYATLRGANAGGWVTTTQGSTGGVAPTANGNVYEDKAISTAFYVRTFNDNFNASFGAACGSNQSGTGTSSLQIDAGGRFLLKGGGGINQTVTVSNLILAGAQFDTSGDQTFLGTINLIGTVSNNATYTTANVTASTIDDTLLNSNFLINALIQGTGNVNYGATGNVSFGNANAVAGNVVLGANNTYTGSTVVQNGVLQLGNGGTAGSINSTSSITVQSGGTLKFNRSDAGLTIAKNIAGPGQVQQVGSGSTTLTGSNTYIGATGVNAGTLYVDGSTAAGSIVNVSNTVTPVTLVVTAVGTLGGSGTVNGLVNVLVNNGSIEAGHGNAGVLTLAGGLTIGGTANPNPTGVKLNFANHTTLPAPGAASDLVIGGNLTIGTSVLNVNLPVNTPIGSYSILTFTGAGNPNPANYNVSGLIGRPTFTFSNNAGNAKELDLTLLTLGGSIVWTGASSGNWNTTDLNFTFNSNPTAFVEVQDKVIFDDSTGVTSVAITSGDVHPATITFNNSSSTYTFSGTNAIAGPATVTLAGTNSVILTNSNTYTGATTINSGASLFIGNGGTTGATSGSAITNNGTLYYNLTAPITQATNISGSGALNQFGSGVTTLSGTNTYTGATTVLNGTLQLAKPASLYNGNTASWTPANISVNSGATLAVNVGGATDFTDAQVGTLVSGLTTGVSNNGLQAGSNFAISTANATAPVTLSSSLKDSTGTGGGAVGFTKLGNGTLVLTGTNTYTGPTTITTGSLQFSSPSSLYNGNTANWTPSNITVASGATIGLNVSGPNDFTGAQVGTLLTNLANNNNNGLLAGSTIAFDTSNSTSLTTGAKVTAGIIDSNGPGGGAVTVRKIGVGVVELAGVNTYTGPTNVTNGELILSGTNSNPGSLNLTNTIAGGTSIASIRNSAALGGVAGSLNSSLAGINMNATGTLLSASVLEIGGTIGSDPTGNNSDFSFQVVNAATLNNGTAVATGAVAGKGQIVLGFLGNSNDGTGFAAYDPTNSSIPRTVGLVDSTGTALAILQEKTTFGQGSGDHFVLGSPTANSTLILLNQFDLDGGPSRRYASIRGVGSTPEGEYRGAIINSAGGTNNVNFDGNGGLIFSNANSSYTAATLQINGGAIYVAASDPALPVQTPVVTGALGQGNATMQVGTSASVNPGGGTAVPTTAGAHIGFLTSGANGGVGGSPTETSGRNIAVGGANVVYASAVLGGVTNDYSQLTGTVALNEDPTTGRTTTFTARNGGRVDFTNNITGIGSVLVDNSIVEGDATTAGIALNNNGTIVFSGANNTYTGATTVNAGKLYIDGAQTGSTFAVNGAGATLGGKGTIAGGVTIGAVSAGGVLEAGHAGVGTLTLNGGLTFSQNGSINFNELPAAGAPGSLNIPSGVLNTNGNTVTINITTAIPGLGSYALLDYSGGVNASLFTLSNSLPNRALGNLSVNGSNPNELDLNVTGLASIVWKGNLTQNWDTATNNWVVQGGGATAYIDNPGDSVIFDDTASNTNVHLNSGDVHPSSVTFNNTSAKTYTLDGANGIAGTTGINLTGSGTVVVTNANTFAGATVIGAGSTLQLGDGTAGHNGTISNTSGITDNGTLVYNRFGTATFNGVITGTGAVTVNGPGIQILTNSGNNYSGGTTIATGSTLQLGNGTFGNDGAVTGNIANNGTLALNVFSAQALPGIISGAGVVTKSAVGTSTLGGANTFTGGLTVNGGTVSVGVAGTLGASTGTVTVNTGGTVDLNGTTQNIGNLAGTGGTVKNLSSSANATLIIGNGNATGGSFQGVIADGAATKTALTKTGTGTIKLTLTGTSTYTGGTTVNGGTLIVQGNLAATGAVTVLGGRFAGVGTIGNVTVGDGTGAAGSSILDAGIPTFNSVTGQTGTLTVGTLSLNSDAAFRFRFDNTAGLASKLVVNGGALSLGSGTVALTTSDFSVNSSSPAGFTVGAIFDIIQDTTGLSGFFTGLPESSQVQVGNNFFTINYGTVHTGDVTLTALTAVPEPGSLVTIMSGLGMLAGLQRFRRKA